MMFDLRRGNFVGPSNLPLDLLSGRDGSVLWSSDIKIRVSDGFLFVDCRQLDGQGSPELVIVVATDWDYPWRRSISSPEQQHTLAVLAGHSGKVVWKQPLSMAYSGARNRSYHVRQGILRAAYAELSGDGVEDIVIPGERLDDPDSFEMRAINGATGKVLWRHALSPAPSHKKWQVFEQSPVPIIGDLDGDGSPEVLMVEYDLTKTTEPNRVARVIALDGVNGRFKWKWETPVSEDCGRLSAHPEKLDERPTPRVLRTKDGSGLVCLNLWGKPGEIVVLNHEGKFVRKLPGESDKYAFRFWSHDLDSNGDDEILTNQNGELSAVDADSGELMWQWRSPNGENARIVDIWDSTHTPRTATTTTTTTTTTANPTEADETAALGSKSIIAVTTNYAMYGLSGRNAQILWTCDGPHPRAVRGAIRNPSRMLLLNNEGETAKPRVLFQLPEDMAVCRCVSVSDKSQTDVVNYQAKPTTSRAPGDPRLRVRVFSKSRYDKREWATTLWGLAMSLFLIVIPVQYVRTLIVNRLWSLRTFLLLPLICGMIALCLKANKPELVNEGFAVGPTRARINMAVFSLPLITFPLLMLSHARAKKWRSIMQWGLATLVLAIVFTGGTMLGDPRQLRPDERYTFEGWYYALFVGMMMAGWLALLLGLIGRFVKTLKRVLHNRSASPG